MKRSKLWRSVAVFFALLCVAGCFVVHSAAEEPLPNWGGSTPRVSEPVVMATSQEWNSVANISAIRQMVTKAYQLGLFGGGYPFAVMAYWDSDIGGIGIEVAVLPAGGSSVDDYIGDFKDGITVPALDTNADNIVYYCKTPSGSQSVYCPVYRLMVNGCWAVARLEDRHSVTYFSNPSLWGVKNQLFSLFYDGSWTSRNTTGWVSAVNSDAVLPQIASISSAYDYILTGGGIGGSDYDDGYNTGYEDGYGIGFDDGYAEGWDEGYPTGEAVGYQDGYTLGYGEGYDIGYDWGLVEAQPIDIDIPALITSIPAAAKGIINNAFGFELFGINVAGLLSVLLIVGVVTFVVKWLMSR